jgi:hypothetical protein
MGLGSIAAAGLTGALGPRGAQILLGACLPLFTILRWRSLHAFEIGAPVAERPFALLRADPIFAPLPIDTLERLSRDAVELDLDTGDVPITQGEHGDRFYLIEEGRVDVFADGAFRRSQGPGESFGEIALLRDVPRTATVRAVRPTRLLSLDRSHFIAAVSGHRRSHEVADDVAELRLAG